MLLSLIVIIIWHLLPILFLTAKYFYEGSLINEGFKKIPKELNRCLQVVINVESLIHISQFDALSYKNRTVKDTKYIKAHKP